MNTLQANITPFSPKTPTNQFPLPTYLCKYLVQHGESSGFLLYGLIGYTSISNHWF